MCRVYIHVLCVVMRVYANMTCALNFLMMHRQQSELWGRCPRRWGWAAHTPSSLTPQNLTLSVARRAKTTEYRFWRSFSSGTLPKPFPRQRVTPQGGGFGRVPDTLALDSYQPDEQVVLHYGLLAVAARADLTINNGI